MTRPKIKVPSVRYMPKSVQPWMCYTMSGQMRVGMFRFGGYVDSYAGWTITWDRLDKSYRVRGSSETAIFTRKSEAYSFARQNAVTDLDQEAS